MSFVPMNDPKEIPQSYWAAIADKAPPVEPIGGNERAQTVVIGAGFTGLSSALHIAERGMDVLVVDANEPGWGASGRNNGQVVAALKHEPHEIEAEYGKERGAALIEAVGSGPDLVFSLIRKYGIECHATRNGVITAAHSRKSLESLKKRTDTWIERGAPLSMLSKDEAAGRIGSGYYYGANLDPRGGAINPLAYARGLARAAMQSGARIRKNAFVKKVVRGHGKWLVELDRFTIDAEKVIIGTNGYTGDFWPGLKKTLVPARTPQLVSAPLGENIRQSILPGRQSMSDTRRLTLGVRMHPDGRLHLGGGGGTSGADRQAPYERLARMARMLFPDLPDLQWDYRWTGFMGMTPDKYPRLFELAPEVVAMMGYSGRGVAMATLMGRELAKWVAGEARITELALPQADFKTLPYYPIKEILLETALLYYAARDRADHLAGG